MLHIKRLAMHFAEGVDEISNINLLRGTRSAPSRTSTRSKVYIYVFIEKVDSNHDCCRRECAKETSAPEEGVVRA